jgi:hypothetical protein
MYIYQSNHISSIIHGLEFTSDGCSDVKTAFRNGVIDEEVYIEKPQGFEVHPRETHVCILKKALYGLKKSPRAWCRASHYSM